MMVSCLMLTAMPVNAGPVKKCLDSNCKVLELTCKLPPSCNGALTCMDKCKDSSCESQCLSDAAKDASKAWAAAIAAVSMCGGAYGCFDSSWVMRNMTVFSKHVNTMHHMHDMLQMV